MLLPRVHNRQARSELTKRWEVIRNGLAALGEVYSLEFGQDIANQIIGPFDDPLVRRRVRTLAMKRIEDILHSLAQDKLTDDARSNDD